MNWISYILEYCTENGVFDKSRLTGYYKTYIDALLEGDHTTRKTRFLNVLASQSSWAVRRCDSKEEDYFSLLSYFDTLNQKLHLLMPPHEATNRPE